MSIPGIVILWKFAAGEISYQGVIHETGEFGVRFLIVTLVATPLAMMFPSAWFTRWLVLNRRYIGLAAFGYVFLHSLFFLLDQRVRGVNEQEFFSFGIWTGWLAFLFFVLLAVTSNDFAMKELGRDWKTVQRFVYLAAVCTTIHISRGGADAFALGLRRRWPPRVGTRIASLFTSDHTVRVSGVSALREETEFRVRCPENKKRPENRDEYHRPFLSTKANKSGCLRASRSTRKFAKANQKRRGLKLPIITM
jgi:methionine sulfoxide reductase heme-binding subunit